MVPRKLVIVCRDLAVNKNLAVNRTLLLVAAAVEKGSVGNRA